MNTKYAILGAGMQGTAAAYDLGLYGDAHSIILADARFAQASKAAHRVNDLVGREVCFPTEIDVLNEEALATLLTPIDVVLSCVPYWMHPRIAPVAIRTKTHMVDLGGNTEVTWQTLKLDDEAKSAGVTLIPDTGLAPGLVNSVGSYLIDQFDQAESVQLFCGVLPQHPQPPFNYKLTFNIEGLVTEYDHQAVVLRDGKVQLVETLAELENITIEGLGEMEAFTTSGGTSTAPYTFQGRVDNYQYKTIRFPGHCERMRIFKQFGFWNTEEVEVRGTKIKPVDVFCKVFGDALRQIKDADQCLVRGVGMGISDGVRKRVQVDIHDLEDTELGFTAMERTTGFSIAIHAAAIARGELPSGALRYENALSGAQFLEQIESRGVRTITSTELIP